MKSLNRASLLALLAATGALALTVVSIWSTLVSPSDGARLNQHHRAWRANGVLVSPIEERPGGLRSGDRVVAVNGRTMESWAQLLFAPTAPRPTWQFGQTIMYTVVRGGRVLDVPVTLERYPLAAALGDEWGVISFALAFLLAAAFVFGKRPENPAARALLLTASYLLASTLGGSSLQVNDLVDGLGFWLFQATAVGAYMLFWSAAVHFALVFPRPQAIVVRYPWILPIVYAAPFAFNAVYTAAMRFVSLDTLDWIGRSNASNDLLTPIYLILFLIAVISGYRNARDPISRQQVRWVVFALVVSGSVALFLGELPEMVLGHSIIDWNAQSLLALPVPAALAIAILRYRLFDIDVIINRTLVYGVLTACIVGTYVLVVGYLGTLFQTSDNLVISLVAAGLVAVVFHPLRERLQRGVNRLMYGDRDDPYEVISRLGQRLEAAMVPEAVLPAIVETVAQALKLPHTSLWLVEDGTLRLAAAQASTPGEAAIQDAAAIALLRAASDGIQRDDLDGSSAYRAALADLGADLIFPLTHRGDLVGALCLAPRGSGDVFSSADRRLLHDLARQAGAAVHAVRLTIALRASLEELRRSRERLVAAQEEERRRIQRDLHDGLGPSLASMRLRLEVCLDLAQGSPDLIRELERLDELVGQATADIRRLVHGLRPPLLDQLGLVETLRQLAERLRRETGIVVGFAAEADLPVPAAAEVTILRVAQEALLNVQKHAHASQVDVRLNRHGEWVMLEIRDDGVGLSPNGSAVRSGAGLRSMRERAELLGGTLDLASMPGSGTHVALRIPSKT